MIKRLLIALFFIPFISVWSWDDLEERLSSFVLETKKLEIPGFPESWNPSIIRWENRYLLSFRVIPNPKTPFNSLLGVIWLDQEFQPVGEPQILNTREEGDPIPSRAEDGRLVIIGDQLYFIYSDNSESKISKGGFRVYVAQIGSEEGQFFLKNIEILREFEGESRAIREKNWTPFDYQGNLLLAYSQSPHLIFYPIPGLGVCQTLFSTETPHHWDWGGLRGGTPGMEVEGVYLAFFHSCKKMATLHSEGKEMLHYFMGAYTYSLDPPFPITRISPEPIIGKNFYHGPVYKPYWGSLRVVFPCGYVYDDFSLWVAYGRQDREVWIAKLDKKGLLDSLIEIER